MINVLCICACKVLYSYLLACMRTKCQNHLHDKLQSALDLACYPEQLFSTLLVISGWGTTFLPFPIAILKEEKVAWLAKVHSWLLSWPWKIINTRKIRLCFGFDRCRLQLHEYLTLQKRISNELVSCHKSS